jgi:hypothetical protein
MIMARSQAADAWKMPRRDFLRAVGAGAAAMALGSRELQAAASAGEVTGKRKGIATVRGAFLYPSTESLRREGYYSWPGSGFDAEGHHRMYATEIGKIARKIGMRIVMDEKPLFEAESVTRFINEVKEQQPDGLLLIPFKKSEWASIVRIVQETKIPTVTLATIGVLLNPHINQLYREPGVYVISSLDNFDAVESGMRMIRTARWMKESRLVSLVGSVSREMIVPNLGTQVVVFPRRRFAEEFNRTETTDAVRDLARDYLKNARKIVEPTEAEVVDAAKTYFACKRILEAEGGDAIMMECLGGIRERTFPPPCMGFMSLRNEGIASGCQNDLNPTLTLMLVQELFDRPGFQQNASSETEANHYFGAHCTSPTKLSGTSGPSEPYILRNHAEAGVGVVPQVLWREGQETTMALYLSGKEPQMIVYTGKVVRCHDTPPAGGCRTNVEMTINEVDDVCDVKGMHQIIFYGNYAKQLRAFCQLYQIAVVT